MIGKTRQMQDKPRGVLRPQPAHGQFEHERLVPVPALAGLVEHYWYVGWDLSDLPPQQQATLPHPNVHLVVERGEARLYGVHTARFERELAGRDFAFGIKFKAGGCYPFLNAAVATLSNHSLPAQSVFGEPGAALAEHIAACDSPQAMAAVAEAYLLARLPAPDANVARASDLVAQIAADPAMTSVEQLCASAGVDKRTLQRLFQRYVGVGPKWVIQRYRLHEAIAQVQDGTAPAWAELALQLGYFDQAHFGRDFRALVGQSPADYARSLRPVAT